MRDFSRKFRRSFGEILKKHLFTAGIACSSVAALVGCSAPAESAAPIPTVTVTSTVTVTAPAPAPSGQGSVSASGATTTMSLADNLSDVIRNLIRGDKVAAMKLMTPELAKKSEDRTPGEILIGSSDTITGCQLGNRIAIEPADDAQMMSNLSLHGDGFEAVSWQVICPGDSYQILAGSLSADHKLAAIRSYG